MNQVIFIDPGYGKMWNPEGKFSNKNDAFDRTDNNPSCGVSFRGTKFGSVGTFCTDNGVALALSNLKLPTGVTYCHVQIKLSVACKHVTDNFGVGFALSNTAKSPDYLGIKTTGSKYSVIAPSGANLTEDNTGTLEGDFPVGYRNVSLAIYAKSSGITFGVAVDDNFVTLSRADAISPSEQLLFGIWFPTESNHYVSNVIACYGQEATLKELIIPPDTQLAALTMEDTGDNKDFTFKPDPQKEGEFIGSLNGDKLIEKINVFDLTQRIEADNGVSTIGSSASVAASIQSDFINTYGSNTEVATVVVYGNPAYKSKYFSRKVKGHYNGGSHDGFGDVPTVPDTDSTYCIDLKTGDTNLKGIHGKKAGWQISNN